MPIYEYKCRTNGHVFEVRQGFSDPAVDVCEVCQAPVDRIISGGAFHLKGSGWYVTDYKGSGQAAKKEETKPADSKPADTKKSD